MIQLLSFDIGIKNMAYCYCLIGDNDNDNDNDNNDNDNNPKNIYVTTTTIHDQNELSYYSCDSFLDKRLYPDEKVDMMFELVNV